MKKTTFAGIVAAGVVTGVTVYAITESGIVETAEEAVATGAKKITKKVKSKFSKKNDETAAAEEELVTVSD